MAGPEARTDTVLQLGKGGARKSRGELGTGVVPARGGGKGVPGETKPRKSLAGGEKERRRGGWLVSSATLGWHRSGAWAAWMQLA